MENQIRTHRFRWIALHSYHRHHTFVDGFFEGSEMLSFGVFCCDKKNLTSEVFSFTAAVQYSNHDIQYGY